MSRPSDERGVPGRRVGSDAPFYVILSVIGATYVVLILAMLLADAVYMVTGQMPQVASREWTADHPILALAVNNPITIAYSKSSQLIRIN